MTKEKPKRAYRKKTDPHESGVNHPFGGVHPFTEGQQKIVRETVDEMMNRTRPNLNITIVNKKDYFNWREIVWSVALGIMIGIIIAHL